jgi:alpha/beta superfamily hydrolase
MPETPAFPEPRRSVTFASGDVFLEGVLSLPDGAGPFAGVVVCHPHPQMGGTMHNNVVEGLCAGLAGAGIATLRFNFRGVGKSTGTHTGEPGEIEDARGALTFLASQAGIDPERLGMAGYSFGARITVRLAESERRTKGIAAVSGIAREPAALAAYPGAKLFICGDRDHYINAGELTALVDLLPEPKELRVVPNIDHFWAGAEALVGEAVAAFFTKTFA